MFKKLFLLLILIIILLLLIYKKCRIKLLDNRFYDYKEICPDLEILKENRKLILLEVNKINNLNWKDWPEKYLYKDTMSWNFFPFFAFGKWFNKYCAECPNITKILKKIPDLKTAILSKLKAGTKLEPHQGWGKLSNYILRCHYGIIVPDNCNIIVEKEEKKISNDEIVVFDDSKMHYANNFGNFDRIILLLDIKRPNYIKKGNSTIEDTHELNSLLNEL